MIVRRVLRHGTKIAAGSLALLAVIIVGSNDSAFAAQTLTLTVPNTNLTRGQLSASGSFTSSAIGDPGTTETNGSFQAGTCCVLEHLRVNMVIQVDNELMRITGLTEGGLSSDIVTVNRGTAAGFPGAGVVAHATGKSIFRNINFIPVNISNIAPEPGGNLAAALDATEFENSTARLGESINNSLTLFRVDTVEPLFTGRTLLIDSEKMLVQDGGDADQVAVYPGWQINSGATTSALTDEHLVPGLCTDNLDNDVDLKINDGCPAAGNAFVIPEVGAQCDDALDENSFDEPLEGHEDDDGEAPYDEGVDDGDGGRINDGCPNHEAQILISDQSKVNVGWKIKIDNEFMIVTAVQELGSVDVMSVTRGVNSIITSHPAGSTIWGGPDKVEVVRGYAGTTAASHSFLAPIYENVRTLTVSPTSPITEGSHFQIDSEKFTAVTDRDAANKVKAVRAILGTSMASHSSSAAITLIDGLGGTGVTIDYPTTHLDYTLMLPGTFLISTGRAWDSGSCYAPVDVSGQVGVICSTTGEFPLGATGTATPPTVMQVGFTALAYTPHPTSKTITLSQPEAVDSSGDAFGGAVTPTATIKVFYCADFQMPTQDFVVNAVDIAQVRSRFGQPASPSNTIFDVNASSGNIDAVDIGITRSQFGIRCYRP